MGVRKLYWIWTKRRMKTTNFTRHSRNKKLIFIGNFKAEDVIMSSEIGAYLVPAGRVYECFEDNGVNYRCVSDSKEENHSIIAMIKTNGSEYVIGILNYAIEMKNGNIAIKSYFVTKKHRKKGIGSNLIKAMQQAEFDLLRRGANMYVHAAASYFENDDALSQEELERHYIKYGMILCDNCYEGAYENKIPKGKSGKNC